MSMVFRWIIGFLVGFFSRFVFDYLGFTPSQSLAATLVLCIICALVLTLDGVRYKDKKLWRKIEYIRPTTGYVSAEGHHVFAISSLYRGTSNFEQSITLFQEGKVKLSSLIWYLMINSLSSCMDSSYDEYDARREFFYVIVTPQKRGKASIVITDIVE